MTKAELLDAVHGKIEGLNKKQTSDIVDVVFETLADAIRSGGHFSYPGFGTFKVKDRKARSGRNPKTGLPIMIPESRTVSFTPAPKFKDTLMSEKQ